MANLAEHIEDALAAHKLVNVDVRKCEENLALVLKRLDPFGADMGSDMKLAILDRALAHMKENRLPEKFAATICQWKLPVDGDDASVFLPSKPLLVACDGSPA